MPKNRLAAPPEMAYNPPAFTPGQAAREIFVFGEGVLAPPLLFRHFKWPTPVSDSTKGILHTDDAHDKTPRATGLLPCVAPCDFLQSMCFFPGGVSSLRFLTFLAPPLLPNPQNNLAGLRVASVTDVQGQLGRVYSSPSRRASKTSRNRTPNAAQIARPKP